MKIKRTLLMILTLLLMLSGLTTNALASGRVNARAAVMIDASTGQVLYEQNANQKLPVASISKLSPAMLQPSPMIRIILQSGSRRDNPTPFANC